MEDAIAPIINQIRTNESIIHLTDEQKILISIFVVVQHLRVKHFREETKLLEESIANQLKSRAISLDNVSNFKISSDDEIKRSSILMLPDLATKFAPFIFDKHWILLKTIPSRPFIISDNPITLHNDNDYGIFGNIGFAV